MDLNLAHRRRLRLNLGKFRVIEISPAHFVIDIGNKTVIRVNRPPGIDIQMNDLLTFYTEVLTVEKPNA
jgi:hypothetical protein